MFVNFDRFEIDEPVETFAKEEDLKEWIWKNCKEELFNSMRVENVANRSKAEICVKRLNLLDKIAQIQQQQYLHVDEPKIVFGNLLTGILDLLDSEYGFIGEVKIDEDGTKYLQTHAITNIAWNDETRAFYEENIDAGLKFYNMNSLFGHVIVHEEPVIANNPKNDSRGCGVPQGHPPLNHFLGFPFFKNHGSKISGMVGIANKPGGYTQDDLEVLKPLGLTCSNLIQAYGAVRQNKHLIDTLEEKVAERTHKLMIANRQLEEANQRVVEASAAQLEHFACMSHEIRTPLNCVIGLSSLLQETTLSAQQADSLQMIVTSGQLLLTVVNDVLDYSKLASGKFDINIRRTSLQETLDAVVHSIELKARERGIVLKTYYDGLVPEYIDTDNRRLQQILYNLLGNAIKFSKDGGMVEFKLLHTGKTFKKESPIQQGMPSKEVTQERPPEKGLENRRMSRCPFHKSKLEGTSDDAEPVTQDGHFLRFVIKDYGKGIDKKDFEKIFQPFLQASGETDRLYEGTGLGLAITSKLVAGLGGNISVNSVLGEWSEFTFEFPLGGHVADVDEISTDIQNARILLVNDDDSRGPAPEHLDLYKANVAKLDSCEDLKVLAAARGAMDPNRFYICLVREDLYEREAYEMFFKAASNAVLLTFGPEYCVKESKGHFRSLRQVLPSVFMRSLASFTASSSCKDKASSDLCSTPTRKGVSPREETRILIAEDNAINQKVLRRMLERLGLRKIDIVENGRDAVDKCETDKYDIVFMDMQMPVMGGLEATRMIIQRHGKNGPFIAFVTANASECFEAQARESGAQGFISKPFSLKKIESFLETLK